MQVAGVKDLQPLFCFVYNVYLFLRQRERERQYEQERGRGRERETQNHDLSQSQMLIQLSHAGTQELFNTTKIQVTNVTLCKTT